MAPIRARSVSGDTPGSAFTGMASSEPSWPNTRWAVCRSKVAWVVDSRPSSFRRPAILNSSTRPWKRTLILSPSWRPSWRAMASSMTISPGPVGARPAVMLPSGAHAVPMAGPIWAASDRPLSSTSSA